MDERPDEFSLVRRLASRLHGQTNGVIVGIGDDAAVLSVKPDTNLLISTDTMVEQVHFTDKTITYPSLGYKAVAVSISDIAAMGGHPQSVVIALTVPRHVSASALESMYDGVDEICNRYECPLVGGNLSRTDGPLVITSTVTGTVPSGRAVLRSGAQPSDVIFVTGSVGGSGAGLTHMLGNTSIPADDAAWLHARHQRPNPQVTAGLILSASGATSLNDVSDGLASELGEIAAASSVRLRIDAMRVPIAPPVQNFARVRAESPLSYAWYGGEDYELVGTISNFGFARALMQCEAMGIALTQIGRVEHGDGVVANVDGRLEVLEPRGFNHFRNA